MLIEAQHTLGMARLSQTKVKAFNLYNFVFAAYCYSHGEKIYHLQQHIIYYSHEEIAKDKTKN